MRIPNVPVLTVGLLLAVLPSWSASQTPADLLTTLDGRMAEAELSLRGGELQIAESRYRSALMDGWMLMGGIEAGDGRFADARRAFELAASATAQPREALQSLALVQLQLGEANEAVTILTKLVGRDAGDIPSRRLLAQALATNGQQAEAVQELEEAAAAAPDDPELKYLLASGYLRLEKPDAAQRLFDDLVKARPAPQTWVLIGRTYRDVGLYEPARQALQRALKQDPRTRRAHYYLGTIAVMEEGVNRLDDAIDEFQRELKVAPGDPVTSLRLGMALVIAQRHQEALPLLESATRAPSAPADAYHYLGRCQLALDNPAGAVASLRRALDLSRDADATETAVINARNIHYQLALALRKLGSIEEAARHFEEAERASAERADVAREELARYLSDAPAPVAGDARPPVHSSFPLALLAPDQRAELRQRVRPILARAYLNLGVMQAQAKRFDRAAELLAEGARLDPSFPDLQYSLGVACFNAKQFDKAATALELAIATRPADADARRMLALAWMNAGAYDKAAEALRNDPRRETDPSLQYAFGLALVKSGRAADAELIFSQLLAEHGDTPELNVVLGQAHAQQGDYEAAIASLKRAIELKPDVAEANGALGFIYMKQGRLEEAAAALRAEMAAHPDDLLARHTLASVLDLQSQPEAAIAELRPVLKAKPDFADARYLLGKILLAQGAVGEAIDHLEAAARIAPEDANIHYQLGQAYLKSGQTDLAEKEFEVFRQLKDKRRSP